MPGVQRPMVLANVSVHKSVHYFTYQSVAQMEIFMITSVK